MPTLNNSTGVSVSVNALFPTNVVSGPGIAVNKSTGIWSIDLDTASLVELTSLVNPQNYYVAILDTGLGVYEKIRLDNVIAGATGIDQRKPVGDANYTILGGVTPDRYVALTAALTAVRTWTLPPAGAVPGGRVIAIQDEAGGIVGANYLTIAPTGGDTINGVAGNYLIKARFGGAVFRSDGTSKWSVIATPARRAVADANYTALQGDSIIAYTSIAAARIVTLPAATAYPVGQRLTVVDESGSCSGVNTITLNRVGADTISGATNQVITQAFGYIAIESDGTSKWTVVDSSIVQGTQVVGAINGVTVGATTPSTGAFTTLSSTGLATLASISSAAITTSSPRLIRGFDTATNLQINASVASNILTVALKGEDGNDPSPTNPIYLPVRDATLANGDLAWLTLTAATSIAVPSGATLGTLNTQPFRLWLVGFNDAGVFRLGVVNCLSANAIFPLRARMQDAVPSIAISGGSTSPGIFYTSGAGVTAKSFIILGYMDWASGLATAGAYATGPTKIQLFGPGVPAPGEPVGNIAFTFGAGSSTTSATPVDVTGATVTITPTSAANPLRFWFSFSMAANKAGAGLNSEITVAALRAATNIGTSQAGAATTAGLNADAFAGGCIAGVDRPASASALTYKLQHSQTTGSGGTVTTSSVNIVVEELMA